MSELFQTLLNSTALPIAMSTSLIYASAVWLSAVIWVAKDLHSRTHRIELLTGGVLLNVALPGLGFVLYLLLRPQKTLIQQHFQSVEKRLIQEYQLSLAECPQCEESLSKTFLYCPNCSHQLRNKCQDCTEHIPVAYKSCPFCGIRQENRDHRSLRKIKEQEEEREPVKELEEVKIKN